ncbi:F-box protein At4g05010-like [Wolffia australiana]
MGIELSEVAQRVRLTLQKCEPHTRTIGWKRIAVPLSEDDVKDEKQPLPSRIKPTPSNRLESLPEEILVRILCMVNREDLKELILVSKAFRNAALLAKKSHFDVSTPIAKRSAGNDLEMDEAPNAPLRISRPSRLLNPIDLASIAVALFTSKKRPSHQGLL